MCGRYWCLTVSSRSEPRLLPPSVWAPCRFDRGKLLVCPAHWSWPSLQPSYALLDVAAPAGPASVAWGASLGAREGERKGLLAEMTRGGCIDAGVLAGELRDVLLQGAKRELQVRGGGGRGRLWRMRHECGTRCFAGGEGRMCRMLGKRSLLEGTCPISNQPHTIVLRPASPLTRYLWKLHPRSVPRAWPICHQGGTSRRPTTWDWCCTSDGSTPRPMRYCGR